MRRTRSLLLALVLLLCACGSAGQTAGSAPASQPAPVRLLVFSKTAAFRHDSIPEAIAALRRLGREHGVSLDFTEDSAAFTHTNLARYAAVIFLLTTGTVLDDTQAGALEDYIRAGGGYVGIHSASDTEYNWPWYGGLVGAYFDRVHGHSRVTRATVHVVDPSSPSTSLLPASWVRTDEWYNFATNPAGSVHVLLTVDESTYQGGVMGACHPIAWEHAYDGGRAWYTAMGHTPESYSEPLFLAHLWGGIVYAASGRLANTALASPVNVSSPSPHPC
jgi:type 1 glutamine amidotransferase